MGRASITENHLNTVLGSLLETFIEGSRHPESEKAAFSVDVVHFRIGMTG